MKTLVFVLVPYTVASSEIMATADGLIAQHQMPDDSRAEGHFNYLVGSPGSLYDPAAEGMLPATQKRSMQRRLCAIERLPPELPPVP
ncbi:MAG: hypothetical protein MUD01_28790 [Chloroflexaceae bacterium]|jgi:hypothetical protein|nr:hypothetical protein [Chloroflexaceae bacterium]